MNKLFFFGLFVFCMGINASERYEIFDITQTSDPESPQFKPDMPFLEVKYNILNNLKNQGVKNEDRNRLMQNIEGFASELANFNIYLYGKAQEMELNIPNKVINDIKSGYFIDQIKSDVLVEYFWPLYTNRIVKKDIFTDINNNLTNSFDVFFNKNMFKRKLPETLYKVIDAEKGLKKLLWGRNIVKIDELQNKIDDRYEYNISYEGAQRLKKKLVELQEKDKETFPVRRKKFFETFLPSLETLLSSIKSISERYFSHEKPVIPDFGSALEYNLVHNGYPFYIAAGVTDKIHALLNTYSELSHERKKLFAVLNFDLILPLSQEIIDVELLSRVIENVSQNDYAVILEGKTVSQRFIDAKKDLITFLDELLVILLSK